MLHPLGQAHNPTYDYTLFANKNMHPGLYSIIKLHPLIVSFSFFSLLSRRCSCVRTGAPCKSYPVNAGALFRFKITFRVTLTRTESGNCQLIRWKMLLFLNLVVLLQRLLPRLSKKSKWRIPAILASLRINNLQAIEKHKMPSFRLFRQSLLNSSWLKKTRETYFLIISSYWKSWPGML